MVTDAKVGLSVVPTSCPIAISPDVIVTPVPPVNEPLMSDAICAELDTTLSGKEPDISDAI